MLDFGYDFKTNITITATYLPIIGIPLMLIVARKFSRKRKWMIVSLAPVIISIAICLIWGFWVSKVIFRWITDPFYIITLLFFLYLIGHYTYLLKRLVIFLIHKNKAH